MYRFINLSFVGLLGALTVIGSGTPAFGQEFVDDDARFDQRTGASGFFAPGAALIRINGNSLYAPDFSVGVGGQWTTGAAYGVASGATGVTDQGVRITFLSLGIFIEGREDRFRFGAGLQPLLVVFRPAHDQFDELQCRPRGHGTARLRHSGVVGGRVVPSHWHARGGHGYRDRYVLTLRQARHTLVALGVHAPSLSYRNHCPVGRRSSAGAYGARRACRV